MRKDGKWCKQIGLHCPKCDSPKWSNNIKDKYYLCEECDFSFDYLVEDSYIDMLEQKYYVVNEK